MTHLDDEPRDAPMWLCAHDFSAQADHAASEAATELAQKDGTMVLLHVYTAPASTVPMDFPVVDCFGCARPEFEGIVRTDVEEKLLRIKQRLENAHPGLFIETIARQGPPVETIIDVARELDVDRIVVGTHGRHGFAHFVKGSVAERVLQRSVVPVLVVKAPHEPVEAR